VVDAPPRGAVALGRMERAGEELARATAVQESVDELAEVVLEAGVVEARDHDVAGPEPLAQVPRLPAHALPVVVAGTQQPGLDEGLERALYGPSPRPGVVGRADELEREGDEEHTGDAGGDGRAPQRAPRERPADTERHEQRARRHDPDEEVAVELELLRGEAHQRQEEPEQHERRALEAPRTPPAGADRGDEP